MPNTFDINLFPQTSLGLLYFQSNLIYPSTTLTVFSSTSILDDFDGLGKSFLSLIFCMQQGLSLSLKDVWVRGKANNSGWTFLCLYKRRLA